MGVVAWVDRHPITVGEPTPADLAASPAAATGQFSAEGTILIDEKDEPPGVPWLVYQTERRPIATKLLVFSDLRTCLAEAREVPCGTGNPDTLPVTGGERVRIEGRVVAERVYVEQMTFL